VAHSQEAQRARDRRLQAQALLGTSFRVTRDRGKFVPAPFAPHVLATVHPSSILRAANEKSRQSAFEQFVEDLRVAAGALTER